MSGLWWDGYGTAGQARVGQSRRGEDREWAGQGRAGQGGDEVGCAFIHTIWIPYLKLWNHLSCGRFQWCTRTSAYSYFPIKLGNTDEFLIFLRYPWHWPVVLPLSILPVYFYVPLSCLSQLSLTGRRWTLPSCWTLTVIQPFLLHLWSTTLWFGDLPIF